MPLSRADSKRQYDDGTCTLTLSFFLFWAEDGATIVDCKAFGVGDDHVEGAVHCAGVEVDDTKRLQSWKYRVNPIISQQREPNVLG